MKQLLTLTLAAGLSLLALIPISCSDRSAQPTPPAYYRIAFTVSPDGDGSNIYTINPDGTNLAQLTNVTSTRSCDHPFWSPDHQYIYYKDFLDEANDIFRMDTDGGNKINLSNSAGLNRPHNLSPDGTRLSLLSEVAQNSYDLFYLDLDSFAMTNLTNGQYVLGDISRFTPDGLKLFFSVRNGNVYDIHILNIDSTPYATLSNFGADLYRFEISPNGQKLVYESRTSLAGSLDVWTCDIDGTDRVQVSSSGPENLAASWSPDSRKVTYSEFIDQDTCRIVIVDADGSNRTYLSDTAVYEHSPKWSPDGSRIAYIAGGGVASNLYIMNPDGTGKTALTNNVTSGLVHEISWSPPFYAE